MNNERVKVLVNIYLDKYDDLIRKGNDTRDKWAAVSCCVKQWDLGAEHFRDMYAMSMKKAVPLMEEGASRPVEGILMLCDSGREEQVRNAFDALLAPDGGDISQRQDRIVQFVKQINAMLEEEAPAMWHYNHKIRTAIRYLSFIRPQENYYFSAADAAAFCGYTEVEQEIGFDKQLRLQNYYHVCDDLAEYLMTREDLRAKLARSLELKAKECGDPDLSGIDPRMHIMAADLMISAYRSGFYAEKAANRKSRISTSSQRRIERMMQRAKFLNEREKIVDSFDEIVALERQNEIPDLAGHTALHESFGEGVIKEQTGRYLLIDFGTVTKKFALPGVVLNGYLTFEGEDIAGKCLLMQEVEKKRKEIENKLTSVDVQLQMLE